MLLHSNRVKLKDNTDGVAVYVDDLGLAPRKTYIMLL